MRRHVGERWPCAARAAAVCTAPAERAAAASGTSAEPQERPAETNANVDSSASPSVAQLAGLFREQAAAATETPASKPTRRKPPCSLPLFPPKAELGQNGEQKSPPSVSHPPKIKVKSSPLIEKLQANLAFDPAALLPGASPKSPGLKAMVSPFHSPPSTPSSPGVRPRPGEAEQVPVSFDQPPEGSHLPCYNKVRTRGSIKRRPPSRRFRRSQSDCGELGDLRALEASQENGTREENGDEVFTASSKTPGAPPASEGAEGEGSTRAPGPAGKPPPGTSSRTEKQEEKASTPGEAKQGEKAGQNSKTASQGPAQEAPEPPGTASPEREAGGGGPVQEETAGEEEKATSTEEEVERAENQEDRPGHKSQDAEEPEQGAVGDQAPQPPPEDLKGSDVPAQEKGPGEQEKGAALEPGSGPGTLQETSSKMPTDDSPFQDTKM
ncbi:capZ-interacting protein isoform X1 [Sciurus carolinensis]|uniref:capZ-interacting protein isoform X1 n=1 Tax=Sciurus carolinensis TaxID=30640 RepID=UPI001FB237F2|nr:capZ-interacting protein isoform X1 [Sciurus carolinensis]